jgi:hypothetical protein
MYDFTPADDASGVRRAASKARCCAPWNAHHRANHIGVGEPRPDGAIHRIDEIL